MSSIIRPGGLIFRPGIDKVWFSLVNMSILSGHISAIMKTIKSGLGFGLKFLAQDAGADESDQAIMSIANYPYSFKV